MDESNQGGGRHLPIRARSAMTVRGDGELAEEGEGGQAALTEMVAQVREGSSQPHVTFLRRALFIWLRIYICECKTGEKSEVVDLRIPIPVPLIGALFRHKLSWSQAFRFIEKGRRPQGIPLSRMLDSYMAVELLRINEEKNDKEELVVIGFD